MELPQNLINPEPQLLRDLDQFGRHPGLLLQQEQHLGDARRDGVTAKHHAAHAH